MRTNDHREAGGAAPAISRGTAECLGADFRLVAHPVLTCARIET